jgi:hypothetical protein
MHGMRSRSADSMIVARCGLGGPSCEVVERRPVSPAPARRGGPP